MANRTLSSFPDDYDPFAPLAFVLHRERQASRVGKIARRSALGLVLALFVVWAIAPASAMNVARVNALINQPTTTNQYHEDAPGASDESGWSFNMDLARGAETTSADPSSTSRVSYGLRYTIAFGVPADSGGDCSLSWRDTGKVAVTAAVWSLSNRLIRGNSHFTAPGGPTLWGHAVKWSVTAALYDNLSYGEAAQHIAADIASEQIAGWSESLDMGMSADLPKSHWAHNPGNRWEDQAGMTGHLYRANALSMAMLKHRYGRLDGMLIAAPAIGGLGYQAGRELHDRGVTAGWETDTLQNQLFGSRPYVLGELAQGAAMGIGTARTLECGR